MTNSAYRYKLELNVEKNPRRGGIDMVNMDCIQADFTIHKATVM